jgi:hypothetical protein
MKKSGKNYHKQLGMSKGVAEKIIVAGLLAKWTREQYRPDDIIETGYTARNAVSRTFAGKISFLQWQANAQATFSEQIAKDTFDPNAPKNVVFASVLAELLQTGAFDVDNVNYCHEPHFKQVHKAVTSGHAESVPVWVQGALSAYRQARLQEKLADEEREVRIEESGRQADLRQLLGLDENVETATAD